MDKRLDRFRGWLARPLTGRRIAMTASGVIICALSVGIFKASGLGVDPFQVLMAGLDNVIPIDFGTLYMLANIVLLAAMFFADKHYIGLGTVINLFLVGYIAQFSQWVVNLLFPDPGMVGRVIMLIVAIPIMCLSSALYFTADMGVSTYDVWALLIDKKTRFPFRAIRVCTDLLCVGVGFALLGFHTAGSLGIGTIVTALFMGPLVDLFNRKVARPLLYGKNGERKE